MLSCLSAMYGYHTMKFLLILVLLVTQLIISPAEPSPVLKASSTREFLPVEPTTYRLLNDTTTIGAADDIARRKLAPYQLCLICKCCAAGSPNNCATMPCCFGIDCQLPNKPFGVCAFVPKTCNCMSCAS